MTKIVITLFVMHIFAGYFLQSSRISQLKAVKLRYLFEHVGLYTTVFIVLSPVLLGLSFKEGLIYSLLNGFLHFVVDYFTGKFKKGFRGRSELKFNILVGVDYSIHLLILLTTYLYFYPNAMNTLSFWDVA